MQGAYSLRSQLDTQGELLKASCTNTSYGGRIVNDTRGSLWRKWDLHVHTPSSIINDYGGDNENTWEQFLQLGKSPTSV